MLTPEDILGSAGSIARRLERYELRQEQLDMAEAVHRALSVKKHLAVEAGTGVGKSFAYLIPAILNTAGKEEREQENSSRTDDSETIFRVVISTHTISLQEQIVEKDIPFLRSVLPFEFTAVLVKGRSNYLCLRRLGMVREKMGLMLDEDKQGELDRLLQWSAKTQEGSRASLNPEPDRELWNEICCESGNCLGRQCKHYKACFYALARRRIDHAQILVVNHALLFSDLAIQSQGGSILPSYDMLVFDEAHTMEQVAASHLGLSISKGQVDYNLLRLYNARTQKGLLMERDGVPRDLGTAAMISVDECLHRSDLFFEDLRDWLRSHPGGNGRVRQRAVVGGGLPESMRKLSDNLRVIVEQMKNPDRRQELRAARNRIDTLCEEINLWLNQGLEDESVYWVEAATTSMMAPIRTRNRIEICASPIEVGTILRKKLFDKVPSVVMTSATLSTAAATTKAAPFTFFKSQIGLTAVDTLLLGSPFDFRKQATLVYLRKAPLPDQPESVLRPFYETMIRRYLDETDGGAFILFTSYHLLQRTAADLTPWLAQRNMPLFVHGGGMPRTEMVRQFKEASNAVLFGTDSFWQGVDVPGNALRNVIITKLPFMVPSQPVMEAKLESIRNRGGNPFNEYQLPQAILKFKQGFGRLIRTRTDSGLVVVLDPRIHAKSYGRQFIDALPNCRIRVD